MVLVSLLAVAGCFAVLSVLNLHGNGIRRNRLFLIGDYIFHLIAILTNQGGSRDIQIYPGQIAFPLNRVRLVPVSIGYGKRVQWHAHGPSDRA